MSLTEPEKRVFRKHLIESLSGEKAHITFEKVVEDFPPDAINKKVDGIPQSPYDLVEHMRIAQTDIIDFIKNSDYREPNWPDDYWPQREGSPDEWNRSYQSFLKDRNELIRLIENDSLNLFDPLLHAEDYNIFREIMIMANHNSYHTGQLLLLRRALDIWP